LVVASIASLATGTEASLLQRTASTAVSVAAYPFLKVIHGVESRLGYARGIIFNYEGVRETNATLAKKVAEGELYVAHYHELKGQNERLREMLSFQRSEPLLTLEPVAVIERYKGMLIIDRGSIHGVEKTMCLISGEGVVGVVIRADPLTSTVITLLNTQCMVGGMIRRTRAHGIVHGTASDLSQLCTMQYIDLKDDVLPGDIVVTSPDSVFPAGLPIGRVVAVHDTAALWKWAEVDPLVDPYKLDEVFLLVQAQIGTETATGTVEGPSSVVSVAPEAPDTRPIQQRLAP
jgi:rod shape-determining protein MreC